MTFNILLVCTLTYYNGMTIYFSIMFLGTASFSVTPAALFPLDTAYIATLKGTKVLPLHTECHNASVLYTIDYINDPLYSVS
jgi:hypothetical protein